MRTSTPISLPPAELAALPGEVVTHALVRDVPLPAGAGTLALITLDNAKDHKRPSTFGPGGLASLNAALDAIAPRVAAGQIVAVGITGKPYIFCAGADLSTVVSAAGREDAARIALVGHEVFRRLGDLGVPSFAFINGVALGGGLEVALHCTYRTVSTTASVVGLPECFLGLIPGWGGAYLLPNLIGPAAALEVIVHNPLSQNRLLKPAQVLQLGIADALFEGVDFLEESLAWAAAVLRGSATVDRPVIDRSEEAWAIPLARAQAVVDAKVHGSAPAPYRALDLVSAARTLDADAGFAAENEALADLVMSDEFRAGLYAFDLVQKRAKRPVGAPDESIAREITRVGVLGAGLMAAQLALLFVQRLQSAVVLIDLDEERVTRGVQWVHHELASLGERGRLSPDAVNRLTRLVTGSVSKAALQGADLVIEAVFENLTVKKQVLAEVEAHVSDECVLLTNTSGLSVTAMAADLVHPERLVGLHFFNPVAVLPLVEVIRTPLTDDSALATAFALARRLKKSCVLVQDAPAFVVNRVLTRFMGEVMNAVDEGTPLEVAEAGVAPLGVPMSPFTLLQLVGPAVALHVAEGLHSAFPKRFAVSPTLARLVEAGLPGVYAAPAEGRQGSPPAISDAARALLGSGTTPSTAEQVLERAGEALAEEIRLLLDEGVVAQAQDVDLCMILGAGWPMHNGGITAYLDRTGISERVNGKRFHAPGVASLPV